MREITNVRESSSQRSIRDSDSGPKMWIKLSLLIKNVGNLSKSVASLQMQVAKIKRRVIGGGGGALSGMIFRGEYSTDLSYNPQDVVVIRSGPNAGSYVCILANGVGGPQSPIIPDTNGLYWISLTGNVTSMGQWL